MPYEENIPLSRYTSLHVGGPARYFVHAKNDADVQAAVAFARKLGLPYLALGQGSNTIFPDAGYPGVIIHMEDRTLQVAGTTVTAASGVFMRQLINFSHLHGLRGLEELAGIPGTLGGSVRGNAGTWSTETKDHVVSVDVLREGKIEQLSQSDCEFSYRTSIFKKHREWIVLRARFGLAAGDVAEGKRLVALDLKQRHLKQPYDAPSAGSIFKNPDKEHGVYSGKLIESCGLKGFRMGGAEVSPKHANFIVNRAGASATDIIGLIRHVQVAVWQKHQIKLEPEVFIVEELGLRDS